VSEAIEGSDIVIDAVDWPALEIEHWVNSACFSSDIPFMAMSHVPPVARVGPLYVPGKTGCYACQEITYRRTYPLYDDAMEQQRGQASPAATLGSACALIGGEVALDIMHFLTGLATPASQGSSRIIDLRTKEIEIEPVGREPSCPVCANIPLVAEQSLASAASSR
jgi:bacteriocin biosynthesis cyclodehydratase domain-containing protein